MINSPLLQKIKLFPVLALTVVSFNSYELRAAGAPLEPSHGRSPLISQSSHNRRLRISFQLPSRGTPRGTIGGATRGGNCKGKPMAILPRTNLGLTTSDNPVIFVYVPENSGKYAELTLVDQDYQEVYRTSFPLTQQEGILMLRLPEEVNLSEGRQYNWRLSLVSDPNSLDRLRTGGWIEKVAPSQNIVQAQLKSEETWTNINMLAQEGIWYDTLEQLALLHLENPEDEQIQLEWTELLKSVGLEQVAESKILPL